MIRLSNKFHWNIFFLLILLMMAVIFPTPLKACAGEQENLFFIVDASAGMLEKINGRAKIDIIKEAMRTLMTEMPDSQNLGIFAFGHRKKKDCKDVEQIIPLGPLDREQVITGIKSLKPKGKAPLTLSIVKVFDALESFQDKSIIVLVGNCRETCTGEPCKLVKRLKKIGLNFVMHVIGFSVTEKEKSLLSCIVEAGGGKYHAVKDTDEFLAAARSIIEFEPKPHSEALCVAAISDGVGFPAHISVRKDGRIIATGDTSIKNPVRFYVEPGSYSIIVRGLSAEGKNTQSAAVDFKGMEKVMVFDFSEGCLKMRVLKNGLRADGYIYVRRPGTVEPVATGDTADSNPVVIKLQPGTYDVAAFDSENPGEPSLYFSGIEITAGECSEKTIHFTESSPNKLHSWE